MSMRGVLIALEGIDGSGTTTQARRIRDLLGAEGYATHVTAEPSTGPVGRLIRKALTGEISLTDEVLALLFAADRLDHLEREMADPLARGAVVLTDRYLLSSLAYQSTAVPLDWVMQLNARAHRPDLSILLRVPWEVARDRRALRGGDRELFDADARQSAVAAAYDALMERPDVGPTQVVDATMPFDEVTLAIQRAIAPVCAAAGRSNERTSGPAGKGPSK